MELVGKTAVVTGGASGIGRAICARFAAEGARVIVADRDAEAAARVAGELGATAHPVDVARPGAIEELVAAAGAVDVLVSNAGVAVGGGPEAPDEEWQRAWDVHVMAQVRAVRLVLPGMLARGGGVLVTTASAAGLLTNLDAAPYAVTKHAAVAFAEWLAVTYGDCGIQVACICPMAVRTPMIDGDALALRSVRAAGATVEPDSVAAALVDALRARRFLVLPHPEVADFVQRKAADPDGWIAGMQRFRAKLEKK